MDKILRVCKTVMVASVESDNSWQNGVVQYCSITELAPLLDEDEDEVVTRQMWTLRCLTPTSIVAH